MIFDLHKICISSIPDKWSNLSWVSSNVTTGIYPVTMIAVLWRNTAVNKIFSNDDLKKRTFAASML